MRLALVGCGKSDRDEPSPAGDMYTSPYASVKSDYKSACCDAGFILSGKHALVPWRDVIEPYNLTIDDYPVPADDVPFVDDGIAMVEDWATEVLGGIDSVLRRGDMATGEQVEELVILAGEKYRDPIRDGLEDLTEQHEVELTSPFEANDLGGMGPQMSWMNARVEEAQTPVTDGGVTLPERCRKRRTNPVEECDHDDTETDYLERADGQHEVEVCADCGLIVTDNGLPEPTNVATDGGGLREECQDCDWSETWSSGSAADDPGIKHAKETGHTVSTSTIATDGGQQIQQVFETVDSESAARDLLDAVEPKETMLEYKVTGDGGFAGAVDTVRKSQHHDDEVQVRSFLGGSPLWIGEEEAVAQLVGHPARVVDYEGIA